jgi:hypothetical protein
MKRKSMLAMATLTVILAVVSGTAISAQDKYTVNVSNGLAFSSSGDTKAGRSSASVRLGKRSR